MRLLSAGVVVTALSFGAGCAGGVNGEVDGKAVDMLLSAFSIERENDVLDADGEEATLTSVTGVAISALDGCGAQTRAQQNANTALEDRFADLEDAEGDADKIKDAEEKFANAIVDFEVANFPTDFWAVSVGISTIEDGDIDGGDAKIDFSEAPPDADELTGVVSVCRINDHPSVGEDDNDIPVVERDQDCFVIFDGEVTVSKWEPGAAYNVTASGTLGDPEDPDDDGLPADVGEVEITVSAGFCQTLNDALDEQDDIIEDALDG